MPAKAAHLTLAHHNQDLLDHLVSTQLEKFPDWIATVAFYKAVHLVEALFDHHGYPHSINHEMRNEQIKGDNRYKNIFKHYFPLQTASRCARYLFNPFPGTPREFTDIYAPDDVQGKLLNHHLHQLENSVKRFLDPPPPRRR